VGGLHGVYLVVAVIVMVEIEHTVELAAIQHHRTVENLAWEDHPILRTVDL